MIIAERKKGESGRINDLRVFLVTFCLTTAHVTFYIALSLLGLELRNRSGEVWAFNSISARLKTRSNSLQRRLRPEHGIHSSLLIMRPKFGEILFFNLIFFSLDPGTANPSTY